MRTEGLRALRAGVGCLNVDLRLPAQNTKMLGLSGDASAKRRSRKRLAVGAMTKPCRFGIDDGLVSYCAAMAPTESSVESPKSFHSDRALRSIRDVLKFQE